MEEGSCSRQTRFMRASFSDLSGDTITGASFCRNKKSTSQGFGFHLIVPSSVLPCVGSKGAVDV